MSLYFPPILSTGKLAPFGFSSITFLLLHFSLRVNDLPALWSVSADSLILTKQDFKIMFGLSSLWITSTLKIRHQQAIECRKCGNDIATLIHQKP